MKYYRQADRDARSAKRLKDYDALIRARVGASYPYRIRMRHWELCEILQRLPAELENIEVLDTGSFNTYLGIWLAEIASRVVVSDLLFRRALVSGLRRLRIFRPKPTEAPFEAWYGTLRRAAPTIEIKNVDLTRMPFPDESFDYITSISVIEHIPKVDRTVAEMYRCLKPNGKLLLTTDSSPTGKPYAGGVRYFTESELESLFDAYPVTSPKVAADFSEENWSYFKDKPLTTVFIEITKPAATSQKKGSELIFLRKILTLTPFYRPLLSNIVLLFIHPTPYSGLRKLPPRSKVMRQSQEGSTDTWRPRRATRIEEEVR